MKGLQGLVREPTTEEILATMIGTIRNQLITKQIRDSGIMDQFGNLLLSAINGRIVPEIIRQGDNAIIYDCFTKISTLAVNPNTQSSPVDISIQYKIKDTVIASDALSIVFPLTGNATITASRRRGEGVDRMERTRVFDRETFEGVQDIQFPVLLTNHI